MGVHYKCPVCQGALGLNDYRQWVCADLHSFDMAKQGYVNLHLAHQRRSAAPGDTPEMLASRARFLNAGSYDFLVDQLVAQLADEWLPEGAFLDQGCGEGFYLDRITRQLPQVSPMQWWGIDISKAAVKRAAQRVDRAHLAVAASRALPFFDADFDRIISVFAPYDSQEMARVLKPGGQVIVVGPDALHLDGLKRLIYDHNQPHQGNFGPMTQSPYFTLQSATKLQKAVVIEGSEIGDLLAMTPYFWSAGRQAQATVRRLESLETHLAFDVRVYRRLSIPIDSTETATSLVL